jgi:hypothetical protein
MSSGRHSPLSLHAATVHATFSSHTPTAIRVPFTIAAVIVMVFAIVMFLRRRKK